MYFTTFLTILLPSIIYSRKLESFFRSSTSFEADSYVDLAQKYLEQYGYMGKTSGRVGSLQRLDTAIEKFQEFAGLKVTGELDSETVEMMQKPRCGVKDFIDEDEDIDSPRIKVRGVLSRRKRYVLQGSRWRVKNLTYRITKYPRSRLSKREVDQTMRKAFNVWEQATGLQFEERSSGKVHIEIRFERKAHGDDDPFDGLGGTLAHAFFPVYVGDVHFDDDEDWTVNTPRGTSLLMTASHELGHSLGLSHSNVRSALMAPFYRGYEENISLDDDDVRGIQALYGDGGDDDDQDTRPSSVGVRTSAFTPRPVTSAPRPQTPSYDNTELCTGNLDTIITVKNDSTYAFFRDKYWRLTDTAIASGYPRDISQDWDGLPGDLDASFTWTNGKTYFFKGDKYWRFSEIGIMDRGYPKDFSKGFDGIPDDVDSAMVWAVNKKIYFFKGSQYWKFDPDKKPPVDASYPRQISNWDGIPNNLDAALQYKNGKTYFFKNGKYYRFDDEKFVLDEDANPSFPREAGFWWFGCDPNSVRLTRTDISDDYDDNSEDIMWSDFSK